MDAEYIQDNYGQCKMDQNGKGCQCRKNGLWLGKSCWNWVPVKATTLEELNEEMRKFRDGQMGIA